MVESERWVNKIMDDIKYSDNNNNNNIYIHIYMRTFTRK